MKIQFWKLGILVFLFAFLISISNQSKIYKRKGVYVLDSTNIDDMIKKHQLLLVYFYSSTPESQDYKEELYDAAKILDRTKYDQPFIAKYKLTKKEEYTKYNIPKAPIYIYFIDGQPHNFSLLSSGQILQILQRVESKIITVTNQDEINLITKDASPYTINLMYIGNFDDKEFQEFLEFKDSLKNIRFSICTSDICKKKYPKANQSFILFKNYLPRKEVVFDRSFPENNLTKERITEWIDQNTEGYVMSFTDRFLNVGFGVKKIAFIIWRKNSSKMVKDYYKILTNVAKSSKYNDLAYYASDVDADEETKKAAQYFLMKKNFEGFELPNAAIYDNRDGSLKTYQLDQNKYTISEAGIKNFIDDFKEGIISRLMFSQSIEEAEKNQKEVGSKIAMGDSRVQALVKDNFDAEVISNNLDVFVMFYADWCEHCHELMPLYENLAQYMSLNEKLKFKKIDLSKNTVDGLGITEYPTLKLYPANNKESPVEYLGNAYLEEFANFIKKYSNHTIDIPKIVKEIDKQNEKVDDEINLDSDKPDL